MNAPRSPFFTAYPYGPRPASGVASTLFVDLLNAQTVAGLKTFTSTIRTTGSSAPASGAGVETFYTGGEGYIIAFDRTGGVYKNLNLSGLVTVLSVQGTPRLTAAASVVTAAVPLQFASYTLATLPSAAGATRGQIWVSDMTGGAQYAYSDGTNWRRVSDLTIAS